MTMIYITLAIINLLFAYTNANGCELFCIENCSVLNGNYTNECQNCSMDYKCNPLSREYIKPWIPNITSVFTTIQKNQHDILIDLLDYTDESKSLTV